MRPNAGDWRAVTNLQRSQAMVRAAVQGQKSMGSGEGQGKGCNDQTALCSSCFNDLIKTL